MPSRSPSRSHSGSSDPEHSPRPIQWRSKPPDQGAHHDHCPTSSFQPFPLTSFLVWTSAWNPDKAQWGQQCLVCPHSPIFHSTKVARHGHCSKHRANVLRALSTFRLERRKRKRAVLPSSDNSEDDHEDTVRSSCSSDPIQSGSEEEVVVAHGTNGSERLGSIDSVPSMSSVGMDVPVAHDSQIVRGVSPITSPSPRGLTRTSTQSLPHQSGYTSPTRVPTSRTPTNTICVRQPHLGESWSSGRLGRSYRASPSRRTPPPPPNRPTLHSILGTTTTPGPRTPGERHNSTTMRRSLGFTSVPHTYRRPTSSRSPTRSTLPAQNGTQLVFSPTTPTPQPRIRASRKKRKDVQTSLRFA